MINYIAQFDQFKEQIPEFIVKLYHILESKEYEEFMCWFGDNEILIKNGKKLEDKVLPHFFRHRHLSSFIRQLNMYKFGKVNKLTKEKHFMYFRNEHFKRNQIKEMTKIKRNNKKKSKEEKELQASHEGHLSDAENSQISINKQLDNNILNNYKQYVRTTVRDISESLKKIETAYPQAKSQLEHALSLCQNLMDGQEAGQSVLNPQLGMSMAMEDSVQNKNMLSTMRLIPRIDSLIFPSQCSFYHFN